ncbi:MAG: LysR family transcriptional regulator [Erysipelotrichaceae bacterium]|nr:LysR family transcriptional regulator [Erysipelotrichaceae bacterium]
MKLEELRWLNSLFRNCNISATAEEHYITQSALSQCLQRVEREVGFPLFERSNKGLRPTEKGQVFAKTITRMLKAYSDFEQQIYLMDHPALNEIRIGMAPFIASVCSAELLLELSRKYPAVHFSVLDAHTKDMLEAMDSHEVHMIIVNQAVPKEQFDSILFGKMSTGIFLRKGSPVESHIEMHAGKKYLDPVWLKDEPIAVTRKGQASRRIADSIFIEAGFSPNIVQEIRNMSGLYKLAKEGLTSAVCTITREVNEWDQDENLICRVPKQYSMAQTQWQILLQPNIADSIPKDVFRVIEKVIQGVTVI